MDQQSCFPVVLKGFSYEKSPKTGLWVGKALYLFEVPPNPNRGKLPEQL
jgi:hypothetical protein